MQAARGLVVESFNLGGAEGETACGHQEVGPGRQESVQLPRGDADLPFSRRESGWGRRRDGSWRLHRGPFSLGTRPAL